MRCKGCQLSGPTPFFDNAPGSLLRNALVSPERAQGHATVVDHSREVPSQKRDLFENCFRPRRARPARYLVISVALVAVRACFRVRRRSTRTSTDGPAGSSVNPWQLGRIYLQMLF